MTRTSLLAAMAATLLLGACTTPAPLSFEVDNARVYPESRDAMWKRVLAYSVRESLRLSTMDPANGLITVERDFPQPTGGGTIMDWADCGGDGAFERPLSQHVSLTYLVRPHGPGSSITVSGEYRELRQNVASRKAHWVVCTSTGALERKMLQSLFYGA